MEKKDTIYCLGDSHVGFFSGSDDMQPIWPEESTNKIPLFRSFRLGPVTAYNLAKLNSSTQGREKLFAVLDSMPPASRVLLCFGEIDCRVHLLKQAKLQNRSLELVVKECVDNYWSVIQEVKQKGFKVLIWGAVASTIDGNIVEQDYVAYGSCVERNVVTKIFNDYLKELADSDGIDFISIFDILIKKDGTTNLKYYVDRIHLSQKAMPLVIKKLRVNFPELKISLFSSLFFGGLPWSIQVFIFKLVCCMRVFSHKFKMYILKFKQLVFKVINHSQRLVDFKIIVDWYRLGRPVPPPHLIKQKIIKKYAKKFYINTFVESGTFLGDMVMAVVGNFKKIYSIELSPELAKKAKDRFIDCKNVRIVSGDSGQVIVDLLSEVNEPALFWLDGHYSAGNTAKGQLDTPIIQELSAIFAHPIKNHVILIDDARLFNGSNDYPSLVELEKFVKNINPQLSMAVSDDIIRIVSK